MTLKYCQGPSCHTYETKDRLKGTKPNKTYQTRRRSNLYYGNGNFCDMCCQHDWFMKFGNQAIDHYGRVKEVKHLTEKNAWRKNYNYYSDRPYDYYAVNTITKERRSLTESQYDDSTYTLNER
jgi:hypothetical protein